MPGNGVEANHPPLRYQIRALRGLRKLAFSDFAVPLGAMQSLGGFLRRSRGGTSSDWAVSIGRCSLGRSAPRE